MTSDGRVLYRRLGGAILAASLVAMYAPVVMLFVYSFNKSRIGSVWTGFSTDAYVGVFDLPDLWAALRMSLIVATTASTASVALGVLAALGLKQWSRRTRRVAEGLLALPLVVPDIIMAVSLALFFHAFVSRQGMATVMAAHVAFGVSYAFVVLTAAVGDLDENLHAAALDCGATPWRAFWMVTLPLLAPSIMVAWLLVFSLSFDDFLITFFTTGPGNDTLPIKIYSQMRFGVRPETNALFVLLFLATSLGLVFAGWFASLRKRRSGRA